MSVRVETSADGVDIEYRSGRYDDHPAVRAYGPTLADAIEQLFEKLGHMRDECAAGLAKIGIRVRFESDAAKGELS